MLFHKATKTAFVLPVKNGTTSLSSCLVGLGFKYLVPKGRLGQSLKHALPKDCLAAYPALSGYRFYGFFRNPLDRLISMMRMFENAGLNVTYKDFDCKKRSNLLMDIHLARQVDWLNHPNTTAMDFDAFESELQSFGERHGYQKFHVPKLNAGKGSLKVTRDIQEFVRDYYADDYKFAKQAFGKEF